MGVTTIGLLVILGAVLVLLVLGWAKSLDERMPLPECEPCGVCQGIDIEFVLKGYDGGKYGDRHVLFMKCPHCRSSSLPVEASERPTRGDRVRAQREWNKMMRNEHTPPPFL